MIKRKFPFRIAVVRESGGFGDCICAAGTCRQLKLENPGSHVKVFCPGGFIPIYGHCEGIDSAESLGEVKDLSGKRRSRNANLNCKLYPVSYLGELYSWHPHKVVDLWCPGAVHECSTVGPLLFNRNELFAMSAGCKDISARAVWHPTELDKIAADRFLRNNRLQANGFLAVSFRGTDNIRSYPSSMATSLVELLLTRLPVVYFDCIIPHFTVKSDNFFFPSVQFEVMAAIVQKARAVVTIDSALLHLAGALSKPSVAILGPTDRVVARAYPKCSVVEAWDYECPIPCNYSSHKGWVHPTKTEPAPCRKNGCRRMARVRPMMVFNKVVSILENSDVRFV